MPNQEHKVKPRVITKHASPQEWASSTLKPFKGEMIIYDRESSDKRLKIGDGESSPEELKFIDQFETSILTVNPLGGIAAGENLNGLSIQEILTKLIYPYVKFVINSASRSSAAATLECGSTQSLSSASINVTKKSYNIQSISLYADSTLIETKTNPNVSSTVTFNFDSITVSKTNNPTLKFVVSDGTTTEEKLLNASTFVYPYYYGVCAANETIDAELVTYKMKEVVSKKSQTKTFTCNDERIVFAYPSEYGALKSIKDPNGFETIGGYTRTEVAITGLDGTSQSYYVYTSGAATAENFKVTFTF